jgi:hypothetical protein
LPATFGLGIDILKNVERFFCETPCSIKDLERDNDTSPIALKISVPQP